MKVFRCCGYGWWATSGNLYSALSSAFIWSDGDTAFRPSWIGERSSHYNWKAAFDALELWE